MIFYGNIQYDEIGAPPDFATCSTNISTKKIKNLRKIWDFLLTNSL
nr:MAG TPA_asm: hypothetical protein [Caudoviricetes sp.]